MPKAKKSELIKKYNEAVAAYYKAKTAYEKAVYNLETARAEAIVKGVPGNNEMERRAHLDVKLVERRKAVVNAKAEMFKAKARMLQYAALLGIIEREGRNE